MKKKIDSKRRRLRVADMEGNAPPAVYEARLDGDLAKKLDLVRKRYGSIANFFKANKARSLRRGTNESLIGRHRIKLTT
jgi:hypothetical protein